jgi:hypothetical protein
LRHSDLQPRNLAPVENTVPSNVDAVDVATPTSLREQISVAAAIRKGAAYGKREMVLLFRRLKTIATE